MARAYDLSTRYFNMRSIDLRRLKSQKEMRQTALRSKKMGYFDLQEMRTLEAQLKWINAELAARDRQIMFDIPE